LGHALQRADAIIDKRALEDWMPGLTALVPLDGTKLSESAFALLPLIKTLGFTKLRLVSVWDNVWSDREALVNRPEGEREELAEKGRAYLDGYVAQHVAEARRAGFEAETIVRAGRAAEEVLLVSQDVDLILIATHGRSGIARWRLGSVADKIVREAPCPTLVIGPNVSVELESYALKRIVVPLDGTELGELALPLAVWIAGLTGAEIDLLRCVSITSVAYDPTLGVYPVDLLTAMEDAAKTYLQEVANRVGNKSKVSMHMKVGSAGEEIIEHLTQTKADLVAMASHGRGGLVRAALGSVTDQVLHGPAPVFVVRPDEVAVSRLLVDARSST
jgi:nucleotide-binding universal stress UspA family protein